MAIVRRKDKNSGSVAWLSVTTALLELHRDIKIDETEAENMLRHGVILESSRYAYEWMD